MVEREAPIAKGPVVPSELYEIQWTDSREVRCVIRPKGCPLGPQNWFERLDRELPYFLRVMQPFCRLCGRQGRIEPYPCGIVWKTRFNISYLHEVGSRKKLFMGMTCDICGARSPLPEEQAMTWAAEHAEVCRRLDR